MISSVKFYQKATSDVYDRSLRPTSIVSNVTELVVEFVEQKNKRSQCPFDCVERIGQNSFTTRR
jgi:hypothetical protein